ncbi:hypothetical protein [Clostridium sp.]|uniref:hypothetical protein n=1 Tax=Clostridium sp. TaxID=1506 RepID=UPI0026058A69|nr:hypothetical protein [Clostridium sp.]
MEIKEYTFIEVNGVKKLYKNNINNLQSTINDIETNRKHYTATQERFKRVINNSNVITLYSNKSTKTGLKEQIKGIFKLTNKELNFVVATMSVLAVIILAITFI